MFFLYSFLYTLAFLVMSPLFLLRREKYVPGFRQRLGNYPDFESDSKPVIWLHCVSVGEVNAARPLVEGLKKFLPNHRLVISTTTRTGQELADKIFHDRVDAVVYFPFDWKFSVRRALDRFRPSVVLLMETEIWPRFIHEAKTSGTKIAIVNGRLSQASFGRYSKVRSFVGRVLSEVDLALMQTENDAERIEGLGMDRSRIFLTGNLKFDLFADDKETQVAAEFRNRFDISGTPPLIVAASTHEPEEELILAAVSSLQHDVRLLIAPRHPERFEEVWKVIGAAGFPAARRSRKPSKNDRLAKVILLDSIGELRAAYGLADIVFVGGSLVPHGGQSILEPASVGKPVVTGPYTHNFDAVVREFRRQEAIIQIENTGDRSDSVEKLAGQFARLLGDPQLRDELGRNALRTMKENEGSTRKTLLMLSDIFGKPE